MPKIKLELNKPLTDALKFARGKHYESTLPGKAGSYMYSLESGAVIFLDEDDCQEPDEMFAAAHVAAGVPFSICLRKRNGARYYEVKNLSEPQQATVPRREHANGGTSFEGLPSGFDDAASSKYERQLEASIAAVKAQRASSAPAGQAAAMPISGTQQYSPQSTPAAAPIAHTVASRAMAGAMIAAFDAMQETVAYAKSKGVTLEFSSEDLRSTAATIYIQIAKDPHLYAAGAQNANGRATAWQ